MAEEGRLEGSHIVALASKISVNVMENIATAKFDLSSATLGNIKTDYPGNSEKQSQVMIEKWKNSLPVSANQIKSLAKILYEASHEDYNVDRYEVFVILKVTEDDVKDVVIDTGSGQVPLPPPGGATKEITELTPAMEISLSEVITNPGDLRDLGTRGFGFRHTVIDSALTDNRGINDAALSVIKKWSDKQRKAEKYKLLCGILVQIKKPAWIEAMSD